MAVIFGGYNSLVDVLALNIPAIVIMRSMQDLEQQQASQFQAAWLNRGKAEE